MAGKRKPPASPLDLVDEALTVATNNDVLEILKRTLESISARASATADLVCDDDVPREALFEARLFVQSSYDLTPRMIVNSPRWVRDVQMTVMHARDDVEKTLEAAMRAAVDA